MEGEHEPWIPAFAHDSPENGSFAPRARALQYQRWRVHSIIRSCHRGGGLYIFRGAGLLTGHPEVAHVLEREARRDATPDAFVDPTALPSLVAGSRAAFEAPLAAGRAAGR